MERVLLTPYEIHIIWGMLVDKKVRDGMLPDKMRALKEKLEAKMKELENE